MAGRVCYACGSLESDTPFPAKRPRAHHLCCDCVTEWPEEQQRRARVQVWRRYRRAYRITTRASYRAQLRWRQGLPQADLVDLVVPVP